MFMQTQDGTRLSYSLAGDPQSLSKLALVHSLAMDRSFWDPVVELLSPLATILTFDCRGHGLSDKPAGPYRVEGFADDLRDLFDHVGWKTATVGGASMGGCVSLAFAQRHPSRAKGLALFDTTAWYGADAPTAWAERASKAMSEGLTALANFQATRWFSDGFRTRRPDVVKACVQIFLANDVRAYAATCEMLGACDLRSGLSALNIPTRILVGDEDYATPIAMAQALNIAIPHSTLTIEAGARHLTPLEIPQKVADEIKRLF